MKKFILPFFLILLSYSVGLIPFFVQRTRSQVPKSKSPKSETAKILQILTQDLDADGKDEQIRLTLMRENPSYKSGTKFVNNARLAVWQGNKERVSKAFFTQWNAAEVSLVSLFGDYRRQIMLTTGTGAHSLLIYLYDWRDDRLIPLCPAPDERQETEIELGSDCLFFSGGGDLSPKDFNGDGIDEMVMLGRTIDNELQYPHQFYQWDGQHYVKAGRRRQEQFLDLLTSCSFGEY